MDNTTHFGNQTDKQHITLATTGTTSGGKSSLVNLLCGAEIMPVGVQEMSAGKVIIDHHPTKRSLKIPLIEGLPVDYGGYYSGYWSDLPDREICERLKAVMVAYRQLREETSRPPPAPCIELQYPTRLGQHPELLGLHNNFKLRIIDLPGLKHIDDDHNRDVIREEIKSALCLVTYNSEETDRNKQHQLLDEVIKGVKDIGGSPARMLFILNKIDVFSRHDTWEEDTEKFIEQIKTQIHTSVAQALPEYEKEAKQLEIQPLSTYPALCAYQALNSEELCIQALDKIENYFYALMPEEIVENLPRDINKWNEYDRKQVAEYVWSSSYGDSFYKTLSRHIKMFNEHQIIDNIKKEITKPLEEKIAQLQSEIQRLNSDIKKIFQSISISRYTDNDDGTITDNKTGLIWLKNANCFGEQDWETAMQSAAKLADGQCGLIDGSKAGDWRLPTKEEWEAMVDKRYEYPAISNAAGTDQWREDDAFLDVLPYYYWSSSSDASNTNFAWRVSLRNSIVGSGGKEFSRYVWPVRDGE